MYRLRTTSARSLTAGSGPSNRLVAIAAAGLVELRPAINRLTVIASESFEEYAKNLQTEMEKDIGGGFKFGRVVAKTRRRPTKPKVFAPSQTGASKPLFITDKGAGRYFVHVPKLP